MTDIDTDVEAFLEHFGVKGMHWGVRNESKRNSNLSPRQVKAKQARRSALKKGLIAGGIAAVVSAGAAYALLKMHSYGRTPVSKIPPYKGFTDEQRKVFNHDVLKRSAARIKEAQKPSAEDLRLHNKASDIMERRREAKSAYDAYLKKRGIG